MENSENQIQSSTQQPILLNEESIQSLTETRKWTNFFGILGIITMAFMILAGFIMVFVLPLLNESVTPFPFSPILAGVFYLIISAVYLLPIVFLLRFTSMIRQAISSSDEKLMGTAMKNLALHFRTVGIITIAFIALYILFIAAMILMGPGLFTGNTINM